MYDLQVMDKNEVEASVQEYLDSAIGKGRVRFELCTVGNMTTMSFHRGFDYSSYNADPAKDMMDADAFMMTAHEYKDFMMPVPFPDTSRSRIWLSLSYKSDRLSGRIPEERQDSRGKQDKECMAGYSSSVHCAEGTGWINAGLKKDLFNVYLKRI